MPKMLSPNTTIWWVPADAITSTADLFKATTYTGGTPKAVDISCAIAAGMTLGATDSDTDDSRTICDSGNAKTPAGQKAAGNTSVYDKAFQLFKRGTLDGIKEGYLVQRIGFRQGTPVEAGMELSAFKVVPDNPKDELGDGDKPIQFTVPFLPQGFMDLNKAVAA